MSTNSNSERQLIKFLSEVSSFLKQSVESDWAISTPKEIYKILQDEILRISNKHKFDRTLLNMLFSPTGDIQEISMANGWGEEYLVLSEQYDEYSVKVRKSTKYLRFLRALFPKRDKG